MAFARVSASRWFPYDRGGPSSLSFPFLLFFLSCLLHQPPTLWGNFFLTPRAPPPPARRPFALPGYQLYPRGPHVATVDPPVCVSHLHEGGPGARLVIPRRGRRNPCVRSLRSYKVQFKKILSSLVSTARSRYTLSSRFSLVFPRSSDKSRNSRYPSTPSTTFDSFFLNLSQLLTQRVIENLRAWQMQHSHVNVRISYLRFIYKRNALGYSSREFNNINSSPRILSLVKYSSLALLSPLDVTIYVVPGRTRNIFRW